MKTCDYGGIPCNGLKVGKNSTPGEINRPCKSGSGSASNSSYHFVFHFNNSGFKNPYNLDGPTMLQIGGTDPKQCCLAQGFNPRVLGQTYVWGYNNDNRIKVVTNIGDTNGNNLYLTNSDGNLIVISLSAGNVLKIEKVGRDLISKPLIYNENLFIVKNGSITQYD